MEAGLPMGRATRGQVCAEDLGTAPSRARWDAVTQLAGGSWKQGMSPAGAVSPHSMGDNLVGNRSKPKAKHHG